MLPILTVSQFIEQINGIIAGEFIVEGEVSQYKVSQGKWIFFDLKDNQSILNCFATVYSFKTPLEDGMKVRVTGYPNVRPKSGRFSLTVQAVELVGEGALKRALQLLRQKLTAEGLFDSARKRPLPFLPNKIGVIASLDSAGFGDFKRILTNRWSGLELIVRHAQVQGEKAVEDVVNAFAEFNDCSDSDRPQVIALIRGGGSMDDLAAFNTEDVARAIYGSKAPVIAGIGHERDETLADLAADARASTPSNAAEMLVPDKREFTAQLDFSLEHLSQTLEHAVAVRGHEVSRLFQIIAAKIETPLQRCRLLVDSFNGLLGKIEIKIETGRQNVESAWRLLNNLSPRMVLERGYSITRDLAGKIIRGPNEVDAGDGIVVELAKGKIEAEVVGGVKKQVPEQRALAV